jgi:hypothetical protein
MTSTTKYFGLRGVALLVVAASAGVFACGAAVNNDVDAGDSTTQGQDVTQPPGSDASDATTTSPNDVRSIFGGDTGGPDATAVGDGDVDGTLTDGTTPDGASSGDGGDATSSHHDSGGKETGVPETSTPQDTGTTAEGGVCVVVSVPTDTSGEGTCSPVTTGCGPGNVSGFTPKPHPTTVAAPYKGSCTAAEIDTVYQQCFNGGTGCTSTLPCYACIFSSVGAAAWGPTVVVPNDSAQYSLVELNVGGCLDLLEPCNAPCAYALENQSACEYAACGTNCPITSNAASTTDYDNCATTIDTCAPNGCATYSVGAACASSILPGPDHPGNVCFANEANFELQFDAISAVFCGN